MSNRKDQLRAMFGTPSEKEVSASETSSPKEVPPRAVSGAVKSMGLSLGKVNEDIAEAKALRASLVDSDQIISLDPNKIDAAFVSDRLSKAGSNDEQFSALVESIRESGQQVPVLVRPHPKESDRKAGRYQAAFGHRRIEAARELGIKVKAVIRELSDAELVLAQGKENADRRDLSFIERAFFAKGLLSHGFDRATVQTAMSIHKTEMTRLIQVAESIPSRIARAVGPAPKAGRPRWLVLAGFLEKEANLVKAEFEIGSEDFKHATSDERFQSLFDRLSKPSAKKALKLQIIKDEKGRAFAQFKTTGTKRIVEINDAEYPGFGEFLAGELPKIVAAFAKKNK